MQILFLDIASHQGTLACVTDEKTVSIQTVDHRIGDAELLPVFEKVLKDAGWSENDITHVACVTGPGGFTSLRVGVAFANALAHALGIPSTSIHLSDLYAARVANAQLKVASGIETGNSSLATGNYVWLHSTKTTAMFIRGFGSFAKTWPEATLISIEDLKAKLPEKTVWTGEAIETHRALLEEKKSESAPLKNLNDVLPEFLEKLPYEKALLQPWYGREG